MLEEQQIFSPDWFFHTTIIKIYQNLNNNNPYPTPAGSVVLAD